MRADYANDPDLIKYLNSATKDLRHYYDVNYAHNAVIKRAEPAPVVRPADWSPSKVNFTSRYKKKERADRNELEEYFKLEREDWDGCNPLQWWVGRRGQFPTLFHLARDILTIPGKCKNIFPVYYNILNASSGSAVSVERVFSGGRDTISLRRASLQPQTIRTLMLVKQKLRAARGTRAT